MADLYILTIFTICASIATPLYMLFRNRMTRQARRRKHPLSYYSKKRIFKIAIIIFSLLLPALVLSAAIFLSIIARTGKIFLSQADLPYLATFFITSLIVSYGSGIYIVSIIKEEFTKETLKIDPKFVLEYITNEFFHGPVSHVMVFSGALFMFLIISLLELGYPTRGLTNTHLVIYLVDGIALGIALGMAHYYNDTWKHQIFWAATALLVHQAVLLSSPEVSFYEVPFNLFFAIFSFVLNIMLLIKLIWYHAGKVLYKYDQEEKSLSKFLTAEK